MASKSSIAITATATGRVRTAPNTTRRVSCVASAGYAVLILLRRKPAPAWDMTVPFAPSLAVGFVAAVSLW